MYLLASENKSLQNAWTDIRGGRSAEKDKQNAPSGLANVMWEKYDENTNL
jgi:hypothetical protein